MLRTILLIILLSGIGYMGKDILLSYFPSSTGDPILLTHTPARSIDSAQTKMISSRTHVNLNIASSSLISNIDRSTFNQKNKDYKGPQECSIRKGKTSCKPLYFDWFSHAGKPLMRSQTYNSFDIIIPLTITGNGSISDKALAPYVKSFRSKLEAKINIQTKLNSQLCFDYTVTRDISWLGSYRTEIYSDIKVDLTKFINNQISKYLSLTKKTIESQLPDCNLVQSRLKPLLKTHLYSLGTSETGKPITLSIKPINLALTKIRTSKNVVFTLTMKHITSINEASSNHISSNTSVIVSTETHHDESSLLISIPSHIPYSQIRRVILKYLLTKTIKTRNRFGSHEIQIQSIKLTPTDQNLAISLLINMKHSDKWKQTYGWITILTTPELSNDSRGVKFINPKFTTTAVTEEDWKFIWRALKETIIFDLSSSSITIPIPVEDLAYRSSIAKKLNVLTNHSPWKTTSSTIKSGSLSLLDSGIELSSTIILSASINLKLRPNL